MTATIAAEPTRPAYAALPVSRNTNQGTMTSIIALPETDAAVDPISATIGQRDGGDSTAEQEGSHGRNPDFGTKEDLVIWDQNEQLVVDTITTNLEALPPVAAVRNALVDLAPTYETPANLELARLACNESAIVHATSLSDREVTRELAAAFRECDPSMTPIMASAVAGACLGAVETAFDHWQATDGATSLSSIIDETFEAIGASWPRKPQSK
jgi:hypothetical protein